jgi:diadenylate cyclase
MGSIELFGFLSFGLLDLIDILLVAFLLFKLYELIRGTIAMRIFFGVISVYLFWLLVTALRMELMSQIFRQFINVGVIALIIVFQQEIRRFLLTIGNSGVFRNIGSTSGLWNWLGKDNEKVTLNVHAISEAIFNMASSKTGALVLVEREANIQGIIDNGKKVNADVSTMLIENLFFKNSPLHDGAMVIRGNTIYSASCTLPLTIKRGLPSAFGMRHKAAIGATEESDAIAIIVSEETGEVAICLEGVMESCSDKLAFRERLHNLISEI